MQIGLTYGQAIEHDHPEAEGRRTSVDDAGTFRLRVSTPPLVPLHLFFTYHTPYSPSFQSR
jgi:hypothetical protein